MSAGELLEKLKYIPKNSEVYVCDTYDNNYKKVKVTAPAVSFYGQSEDKTFFIIKV